jgi:hypothetical protein
MIKLPIYKGKAYRVESNLLFGGKTILDVIKFEEQELGNKQDYKHLSSKLRKELSKIPADRCIWVCKIKQDAKIYGTPEEIQLGKNPKIIAYDYCGGYLVLKTK